MSPPQVSLNVQEREEGLIRVSESDFSLPDKKLSHLEEFYLET